MARQQITSKDLDLTAASQQLTNEFMGWPYYVADAFDLDAGLLWWRKMGTPTGGVLSCLLTGETAANQPGNGLSTSTTLYNRGLKCVAAANNDGLKQTWTFADEPRMKVGRSFSVLVALWIAQSAATRTVTLKLNNSDNTNVTVTKQVAAGWNVVPIENLTLAGTTVAFQAYADGAVTFYVVPLGAAVSPRALPLPPRPWRMQESSVNRTVNGVDPGATFTDADFTAASSNLAFMGEFVTLYSNGTSNSNFCNLRRNGDTTVDDRTGFALNPTVTSYSAGRGWCYMDDGQVVEYRGTAAAGDAETLFVTLSHYLEWA